MQSAIPAQERRARNAPTDTHHTFLCAVRTTQFHTRSSARPVLPAIKRSTGSLSEHSHGEDRERKRASQEFPHFPINAAIPLSIRKKNNTAPPLTSSRISLAVQGEPGRLSSKRLAQENENRVLRLWARSFQGRGTREKISSSSGILEFKTLFPCFPVECLLCVTRKRSQLSTSSRGPAASRPQVCPNGG